MNKIGIRYYLRLLFVGAAFLVSPITTLAQNSTAVETSGFVLSASLGNGDYLTSLNGILPPSDPGTGGVTPISFSGSANFNGGGSWVFDTGSAGSSATDSSLQSILAGMGKQTSMDTTGIGGGEAVFSAVTATPEPTTTAFLLFGGAFLFVRRSSRRRTRAESSSQRVGC